MRALILALLLTVVNSGVSAENLQGDVTYVVDSECDRLAVLLYTIATNRDKGWSFVDLGSKWLRDNPTASESMKEYMLNWMYFIYYQVQDKSPTEVHDTVINSCIIRWNKS
jgi:hypothetical protein